MALVPYFAETAFPPLLPGRAVALVHPGGAQTGSLYFRGFELFGRTDKPVKIRIRRYPTKAVGGDASTSYSFLDNAPSATAQVLGGNVSWPVSAPTFDLVARVMIRATGGDAPRGNVTDGAITIGPDHSLVLETLDADPNGPYAFRLYWGEVLPPIPHLLPQLLPASGAFTAGSYFEIPQSWTAVTFWVSYTANALATLGRPKWRISRSDGTNDFVLPFVDEDVDLSIPPIAAQDIYQLERRWPAVVAANTTVRFPVPIELHPGTSRIRLDVAEIGDLVNRGTITATITGR